MFRMSPSPAPGPALSRRSLLAGSAAGLALLVAGCTSSPTGRKDDAATSTQADALAKQVPVQQAVVAAYAAAQAADAALGEQTAELATQAGQQLTRLRAAAPGPTSSRSAASSGTSGATAVPAGQDPQAWLRDQLSAAADSHAAACLPQSGARAALLGSIAAGLRGQVAALS
jgi:hypothetical protein